MNNIHTSQYAGIKVRISGLTDDPTRFQVELSFPYGEHDSFVLKCMVFPYETHTYYHAMAETFADAILAVKLGLVDELPSIGGHFDHVTQLINDLTRDSRFVTEFSGDTSVTNAIFTAGREYHYSGKTRLYERTIHHETSASIIGSGPDATYVYRVKYTLKHTCDDTCSNTNAVTKSMEYTVVNTEPQFSFSAFSKTHADEVWCGLAYAFPR